MKTSYRERDYACGTAMLTLRNEIGLTQAGLANLLGISRRAVGEWETGSSYPKLEHLKRLIALAVKLRAFPAGHEAEEIRTLWQLTRQKALLDESWLSALLTQRRSLYLHLMPKFIEEGIDSTPVGKQELGAAHCVGLAQDPEPVQGPGSAQGATPTVPLVDWADALTVPSFYGREKELALLSQWIVQEHCRVVSVLGMGGIGKSTLAAKTMYQLAVGTAACPCPFEVIIFRSLRDAPSCEVLIAECLQVLSSLPQSGQGQGTVPTQQYYQEQGTVPTESISLLLSLLRRVRVLLVLDNLECLLEDRDVRGHFRPGFEGYGWLLRQAAETAHQSCLLFTSREKPAALRSLGGNPSPVRSLRLAGLEATACQQLIEENGVVSGQQEEEQLIEVCSGNPLALKIAGGIIVDLFGGEISPFLTFETLVTFGNINVLLSEQFARLSDLEQTLLYWLAIMREPVTFCELLPLLAYQLPHVQVFEAIDSLYRHSLIERGERPGSFTLQSIMLEYVTATLIAQVSGEIQQHRLDRLIQHSLYLSQAPAYIQQTQERLFLSPLLADLQRIYPEQAELEAQLLSQLDELRGWTNHAQGYGPANLIALLRLHRGHLSDLDLSCLSIR